MRYVTGLSVRKVRFYHAPPLSTLLMTNQGILTFKNGSMIKMASWKSHLEVRNLVLVWMDMSYSLMMMKRLLQRVTLMRSNTKDFFTDIDYIIDTSEEERVTNYYDQYIGAEVGKLR